LNISVSRVESIVAASILWARSGPKERMKAPLTFSTELPANAI